ncbi:hypothetical protein PR202_ga16562 [Eleusine coracana subsp. coracana]|uniref:non-specific serine/threonine protein kinase n=1 Tax=Eleusine coracana subsp. coracana TaxID=191504 RepID=A0AAV5CMY1_ELECO|nr:hypothetical protein PR202_ga16562 [Eleusine coracana subsp. coracana]
MSGSAMESVDSVGEEADDEDRTARLSYPGAARALGPSGGDRAVAAGERCREESDAGRTKKTKNKKIGPFSYGVDSDTFLQTFFWNGTRPMIRTEPWTGYMVDSSKFLVNNSATIYTAIVSNDEEIYMTYSLPDGSASTRFVLTYSGEYRLEIWRSSAWTVIVKLPVSECNRYGNCGPYGYCDSTVAAGAPTCKCLDGFEPTSLEDWNNGSFSQGCRRKEALQCGDGFLTLTGMKSPDKFVFVKNRSFKECAANCSCVAYAYANLSTRTTKGDGTRCLVWTGDLIDTEKWGDLLPSETLYLRIAGTQKTSALKIVLPTVLATAANCSGMTVACGSGTTALYALSYGEEGAVDLDTPCRRLVRGGSRIHCLLVLASSPQLQVAAASCSGMRVRRAAVSYGSEAIARCNPPSGEGVRKIRLPRALGRRPMKRGDRIRHQPTLASSPQLQAATRWEWGHWQREHRNLVQLLGCSVEGDEKILIYEYLPNGSLDATLFDDRPLMSSVVFALENGSNELPEPNHLAYFAQRGDGKCVCLSHDVWITGVNLAVDGERIGHKLGTWGRTIGRPGEVKGDPHHTCEEERSTNGFAVEPQNHGGDEDGVLTKSGERDARASDKGAQWSRTGRDLSEVRIAGRGDTHRHREVELWASKPVVVVGGACGTITELASRRSKVVKGSRAFGGDMEKRVVNLRVFNGEDFPYWISQTKAYLLSQGRAIWDIVEQEYNIPANLDTAPVYELNKYENNSKAINILLSPLGRNKHDRVAHLNTEHAIWAKLFTYHEGTNQVKSMRKNSKKFVRAVTHACVASLSDIDLTSSKGLTSSEEEVEKPRVKTKDDFTRLCYLTKNDHDMDSGSNSDTSEVPPTVDELSSKLDHLRDIFLMHDDKLRSAVCESRKLKSKLESGEYEITLLRSKLARDDIVVHCESCQVVMNDLSQRESVHAQVANQLESALKELDEFKARATLLGACQKCPKLTSELEAQTLKVKELESKLLNETRSKVLPPPFVVCGSLKDKLAITREENKVLTQENDYLISHLKRTLVSEEKIESDFSRVKESACRSTYNLGLGYESCDKQSANVGKFVSSSSYKDEEQSIKPTHTYYPPNPNPSFNPKQA